MTCTEHIHLKDQVKKDIVLGWVKIIGAEQEKVLMDFINKNICPDYFSTMIMNFLSLASVSSVNALSPNANEKCYLLTGLFQNIADGLNLDLSELKIVAKEQENKNDGMH